MVSEGEEVGNLWRRAGGMVFFCFGCCFLEEGEEEEEDDGFFFLVGFVVCFSFAWLVGCFFLVSCLR